MKTSNQKQRRQYTPSSGRPSTPSLGPGHHGAHLQRIRISSGGTQFIASVPLRTHDGRNKLRPSRYGTSRSRRSATLPRARTQYTPPNWTGIWYNAFSLREPCFVHVPFHFPCLSRPGGLCRRRRRRSVLRTRKPQPPHGLLFARAHH